MGAVPGRRSWSASPRSAPNRPARSPSTPAAGCSASATGSASTLALTVLLVYAGNLTEAELPRRRLVRLLGWLFVVTVAGGLLGMVAGHFEFTSPVELLLPHARPRTRASCSRWCTRTRRRSWTWSATRSPARPRRGATPTPGATTSACWSVWFARAAWRLRPRRRTEAVRAWPAWRSRSCRSSYSLNRGLWIGLGVAAVYVAVRLALAGRLWVDRRAGRGAAVALAVALAATPLGDVVDARLDNGKSNGVRSFLIERALDGVAESPVIGFGVDPRHDRRAATRSPSGESADCERCGNFTVGGNGQLWQLLFAHGLVGTVGYLGFFGYGLWRFRRDRSPIGIAGGAAIVGSFAAMLWYNSLVTPLAFMFLAYALLWRNAVDDGGTDA